MNHISMVPNAPGSQWGQEIELCSHLQNVSFSRDRKVHVYNDLGPTMNVMYLVQLTCISCQMNNISMVTIYNAPGVEAGSINRTIF